MTAALLGALVLAGCGSSGDTGSGVEASEERDVEAFSQIKVEHAIAVLVEVGPTQSVVVHADDNLLEDVKTRVDDATLE